MNQRFWWSLFIFITVATIFLIPFNPWHFDIDDCGMIWSSRFTNFQEFYALITKSCDGNALYFPSNYLKNLGDCRPLFGSLHSFFRPLTLVFFGSQYHFFGANPYPYFFIMIIFHALNTALLFNIVYSFYPSYLWAAWAALFFGFHMSYWGWMGWIAAQPYTISLFFLMLATICFMRYLKTRLIRYNLGTCIFYGLAVFLFEFTFVFPIFICSLWFIYPLKLKTIRKTTGLWLTALFFLIIRHMICPTSTQASANIFTSIKKFCAWLLTRKADYLSFIVDLGNISCIPPGNQILKGSIITMLSGLFFYGFIKTRHKRLVLFCLFNMGLFLWPAILKQYTLRYLYYALPFYSCILLVLIDPIKFCKQEGPLPACHSELDSRLRTFSFLLTIIYWLIVIGNAYFIMQRITNREKDLQVKTTAIQNLVANKRIQDRALCFVAIPRGPFASGLAQNLWMLGIDQNIPIFYDPSTFVEQPQNVKNGDIKITKISDGLRFTSCNKHKVWWTVFGGENMRLGVKTVLDQDDAKIYNITYTFKNIQKYNPLFISWDYETNQFKIIRD